jgi:hypothetical protein
MTSSTAVDPDLAAQQGVARQHLVDDERRGAVELGRGRDRLAEQDQERAHGGQPGAPTRGALRPGEWAPGQGGNSSGGWP